MSPWTVVLFFCAWFGGIFIVAFVFLRLLDAVQRRSSPPTTLRSILRRLRVRKPPDMIGLWKAGVIAGGFIAFFLLADGLWKKKTLARGSATPQRVRHDDLALRGAGDNIHVTITDFKFAPGYVVEEDNGSWQRVWIPMEPASVGRLKVHQRVVVRSSDIDSKRELEEFYRRKEVTGLILEDAGAGGERNDLLRQRNPGLDPNHALIVAEGRGFPSRSGVYIQLAIGVSFIVFAVFCAYRFWSDARRSPEGFVAHLRNEVADPEHRTLLFDDVNSSSPPKILNRLQFEMYALLLLGVGGVFWSILWGLATWRSFERLERGEIQILSVWEMAEFFYYRWGRVAGMVPFLAGLIVSALVIRYSIQKIWDFRAAVGAAAIRSATVELERDKPEFYRSVNEEGRIPLRTKILGGALLLALVWQILLILGF